MPLMPKCLYENMYVSIYRAYMLLNSRDKVLVSNVSSYIKSSHSYVTLPFVPPVRQKTFVRNNVIKKPITCRDSVIQRPRKCPRKSTIVKNSNAVVCFNKSIHKHISSSVNNKSSPSVHASATFCTIVKCMYGHSF